MKSSTQRIGRILLRPSKNKIHGKNWNSLEKERVNRIGGVGKIVD